MNRTTFSLLFLVSAIFAQSLSGPLLSNVPVDVLRSGGLTDGLFNGLKLSRNLGALNGILGGLLGGKGLVVTASYCTSAYVHADIAAHIAIDLPTQRGLLNDLNDVCGKVTTAAAVVDRITSTTTVLDIKAKADVQVVVSVFADIKVGFPSGCTPLTFKDVIFGNVQLGLTIDLSADVEAAASLLSPVLDVAPFTDGSVSLLKWNPVDNSYFALPCHFDTTTGRAFANLGATGIAGTYVFAHIKL